MQRTMITRFLSATGAFLLLAAAVGAANTYVSLTGGFYIIYPDDWSQVDYRIVDAYLFQSQAEREVFDYEAAFAPRSASPFFSQQYLILTIDTVGPLTAGQVDSVVRHMGSAMTAPLKKQRFDHFLRNPVKDTLVYDSVSMAAVALDEITEIQESVKLHMLVTKFYDRGIATFYFYTPDSLLESTARLVGEIVGSFSTENIEDALPKEDLKIADIKESRDDSDTDGGSSKKIYLIIGAALILILVVVIRRLT